MSPLLSIRELRLTASDGRTLLDGIDLDVGEREAVGVVGPSGAGKTTLGLAVLGHLRDGVRYERGHVCIAGEDMFPTPATGVRAAIVGYVGQDPGTALNPYARVSATLSLASGKSLRRRERTAFVASILEHVGLDPDIGDRYPHQLSGGQQQRVAIAAAIARSPGLLVLDEPTTALDVLARREVVDVVARMHREGMALLWIGHDLASMAGLVDRTVAVRDGVLAAGESASIAAAAVSPVVLDRSRQTPAGSPVVEARGITAGHTGTAVLRDVDVAVGRGEAVAVLGVSGVGKSTLARCLVGLHTPWSGQVLVHGKEVAAPVRRRTDTERAALGLVAQNPAEALHPRQDVRTVLARPLRLLRGIRDRQAAAREVGRLLDAVHLSRAVATRLPAELSGGQRQRVALARTLAGDPAVLICDEVTSALDADTQAGIVALLEELRRDRGLGILFITHDVTTVAEISDAVVVLADGRVAAAGATADLLTPGPDLERRTASLLAASTRGGTSRGAP